MEKQRGEVNGVKYYAFTSFDEIFDFVKGKKKILVAINAGKLNEATDKTRRIINDNIGYCDGVGAVWPLKRKGFKEAVRISGCDIWTMFIERWTPEKSFYFIGGKQKIIDTTIAKLKVDYPQIRIAGYRNGFLKSEDEKKVLIADIKEKKPDMVFVAMGSPRQELLMDEMYQEYPAIYQGLGGSFDVYVGAKASPPQWVLDRNLYGIYRTVTDLTWPRVKRLWNDQMFIFKVWLGIIK